MGTRRDIRQIEPELKGMNFVLSVALFKSFARSPAYWVDLYQLPRKNRPAQWCVAVQWHFVRKGEVCEGHTPGDVYNTATQAAQALERRVDKKITEDGWLFYGLDIDGQYQKHAIVDYVSESVKMWTREKKPKVTVSKRQPAPKKRVKTQAERFQAAQRKRKAKAEW